MSDDQDFANDGAGDGAEEGALLDPRAAHDASLSSTLIRGIEILQCFGSGDRSLGNAEIARRVGLNRPTVSRLCKTLVHLGYLRRDRKGAFQLAPKLLALTYPVLSAMPWRHDVLRTMRDLAEMCDGNCSLGVMSGDSFVHIQTAGNPPGWPYIPDIGQTGPLHRSALGWALLSLLDGRDFDDKIAELRAFHAEEFAAFADMTAAAVERCRRQGFCVSYGDWRPTIVAAASPLGRTEDGLSVAIACALPRYRAVADRFETDLGPRLADAAESIRHSGVFTLDGPAGRR
ncbi:IclR family transcriptional regulator [Azospirillum sp. RWY-5-1]|uniref:IclR family transcriptional regulator n=1 Tax=Azospirillum oleiclasticum TaxID=2735135 RepID=A0ABX2TK07_9PROT|nr:IclR family transcriptional regulator [Azospirillum oleiclasticum]NYZ14594.1 IclR family transcriptional regulator [Azospirillum oleiclasticum]NYZ24372.1 IclR family transcriptional regulator [Azospirillum oleiclasticum]